jgi:hypothetical protein
LCCYNKGFPKNRNLFIIVLEAENSKTKALVLLSAESYSLLPRWYLITVSLHGRRQKGKRACPSTLTPFINVLITFKNAEL